MKKFVLVSVLVLASFGFAFGVDHTPAAPIEVSAKISPTFDVVATGGILLDLVEEGVVIGSSQKVADVTVNTNSRYWKLTVGSANNGKLIATDGATYSIPYAFVLKGGAVAGANWAVAETVLNTGIAAADAPWVAAATATVAFNNRTTPGSTDALIGSIYYLGALANAANWMSATTSGAQLTYTDTVTVTARVM